MLEKGDYFGEIAILFNCKRTATITSTNYCSFAKIKKEVFLGAENKFLKKLKLKTTEYRDNSR